MPRKRTSKPLPDAVVTRDERSVGASFPIVGVGASAGGLEAFTQLLNALPLDTGMGFVLIQHLDPEHESALTQILARATKLPVGEITNDQPVQPNHVYVIPRDTNLSIAQGVLKLQPRDRTRAPHRPIDAFFESLAQDQHERAIGVVLSGTASDGTLGLEAIKAEGGITFAQDDSAKHDSMPRSAIAAGCVDLVLSPADIANELARIAKHPYVAGQPLELSTRAEDDRAEATAHEDDDTPLPSGGKGSPRTQSRQVHAEAEHGRAEVAKSGAKSTVQSKAGKAAEDGYKKILLLLRNHSGVDFSLYKSTTIQRRVTRRLVLNKQNTLDDYAQFLRGNAKELDALYSDVLISVTSFFRNPEMFEVLQREVLPTLLKQRGDDPLRVWVLGCSTGQEAYSMAMTFVEAAEKAPRLRKLQVFATDLNEALLDKARHGLYAKSLADDVSPQRLQRFFVEEEGGYRISKMLREMVVFARQNLIADPPFSRMDIISCRNLLIYLEPSLQHKALPTFHYALKPGGFLLLGASESIGGFTDLFEPVDKKHKIYSKRPAPTPAFHLPVKKERGEQPLPTAGRRPPLPMRQPDGPDEPAGSRGEFRGELNAQREADRITVNQFGPPGVLVNAELQVLQFRGPTGAYLEPPTGKASFDVLKMAREGLMLPLRAAINQAKKENKTARKENVRIKQNGKTHTVNLEVIPLKNLRERGLLILFEQARVGEGLAERAGGRTPPPEAIERAGRIARPTAKQESNRITELETDLSETREYLQSMQEQHETANEELQAANEEVQSANEELQSINEELETSKEELESANEELSTVNEEMGNRNVELNRLNDDLVNLQSSAKLPIVLLGRDLTIRRFSPQAEEQFDLLASDIARPIGHIRHNLVLVDAAESTESPLDLERLCAEVIAEVREQALEVRDKAGCWHSLRVRPYMTLDNKVDGAVLVLMGINALKRSEQAVAAARDYAENTIETVRDPLLVLDKELHVESANRSFYRSFGVAPAETIGQFIYDVGNRQWDIPRLRELLEEVLPQNTSIEDFQVEHDFEQLGRRTMLLNARRIDDVQRKTERILLAIEDVTERKRTEEVMAHLAAIVTSSDDAIVSKDLDSVITSWNEGAERLFGYAAEEIIGKPVALLIPADRDDEELGILERIRRGETVDHYETVRQRKDGSLLAVSLTVSPFRDAAGRIIGAAKIARDITERKRTEEAVRESRARFEAVFDTSPVGMYLVDAELRIRLMSRKARPVFGDIGELIGRDFVEVIHILWPPEIADETVARFRHTLETGEPYSAPEFTKERYDRNVREYYDWQIHRLALPDGQYGVVCYFIDISARVLAEQSVREYERRQRLVLDLMPQKIVTAKPNGDIDYFSPQWTEFTGLPFEQTEGWGWKQFIHPDDLAETVRLWQHSIDTGEPFVVEHRFRDADGAYRWHLTRTMAVRDAAGKIGMWIGSCTDVHEQRQTANQLQQLAADLSESDHRKNEFLAMLAHELRNPLAPIRSALQIMRLTGGDRQAVSSASDMMERQVGQMVRLVDDLLDVSRISRGTIELRRERVELASIVDQAVEAARSLVQCMEHELTVTLPPQPIYLNGDPTRLAQVVGNLLNNACKFTDKGGRIALTVEREGEQAVIRLRDNGIGIAADRLPRIFDMFVQVDTSLERSASGLGIGLSLVKNLVEMHDGTVEARSAGLGQGSEFVVRLPIMVETPSLPTEPPVREPPKAMTARRILVVDDNRDAATSLAMLLTLTGNQTHIAYDGREAVEAAAKFKPDVVLLDIGLPKLNGYEVARKIREQPWGKSMVLVAVTGWGQDEDREKSGKAGFDGHMVKPIDHDALTKLLAEFPLVETDS